MTVRTVRIVSSEDKVPSVSCGQSVDSSLGSRRYQLVGVNCTVSEFLEWAFEIYGEGAPLGSSIGACLSISFDDYFSAWLQRTKAWHLSQVRIEVGLVYDSLDIEHCHSVPLCLMSHEKRLQAARLMNKLGLMSSERLAEHVKQCS